MLPTWVEFKAANDTRWTGGGEGCQLDKVLMEQYEQLKKTVPRPPTWT